MKHLQLQLDDERKTHQKQHEEETKLLQKQLADIQKQNDANTKVLKKLDSITPTSNQSPKDTKDTKVTKDSKDTKVTKDSKDTNVSKDTKVSKDKTKKSSKSLIKKELNDGSTGVNISNTQNF